MMKKIALPNKRLWRSYAEGYLFIAPWLLGFFLLTLWPMVQSLYYSFTDYSLLDQERWVGLSNYTKMLTDDSSFRNSVKATLIFVLVAIPLKLIFSLLIAMLMNRKLRGMYIYRTIVYFPSLIGGSVAVAILWSKIFGVDGLVNQFLLLFGVEGKNWIGIPQTALSTLIVLAIWQFGSSMVIFLAGLKQIPQDLYEAAAVDGAGKRVTFLNITLPMLSPIILFNLILQMIGGFQMFTQAFIITNGGPMESTYVYALYLFRKAFTEFSMGYASALAWVMLVIIGLVTLVIFASSRYWVHYETKGA